MDTYIANTQAQFNGDHEVHKSTCTYLPAPIHRRTLGRFATDRAALEAARRIYPRADGCAFCCPAIHSR